jgi:tetratricopeptide (TPR) repeat protein
MQAKADYDKIIAKKPNAATTAEGYYWKAKIYSGLSKDPKNATALAEVKTAIDAYITADVSTNYALAKENGTEPFFDLYLKNFKDGVAAFNEKSWKKAATEFDGAVKYSDIIFAQGWASSKQKFDTTSLMYAGFANQNANNVDQTMVYYKRIVDANIKTPDVQDVYKYILLHYVNSKDKANFDAFLKVTEAAYPQENWFDFKSEYVDKNYTLDEKIKLYDEQVASQ